MQWLRIFDRRRKSPEDDLKELVDSSTAALGAHLKSVILFGSMASGEFHHLHSDVNVMIVTDDALYPALRPLTESLSDWAKKGHATPVIVSSEELQSLARTLPIEFLDMRDHHRLCHGPDPFAGLKVDSTQLRYQSEHDLTVLQLKLRQAAALYGGNAPKLRQVLIDTLPSVLTLFRSILRLKKEIPKMTKIEAAEELGRQMGFDGAELRHLSEHRFMRETDNLDDLLEHYLGIIDKVLNHLRKL